MAIKLHTVNSFFFTRMTMNGHELFMNKKIDDEFVKIIDNSRFTKRHSISVNNSG